MFVLLGKESEIHYWSELSKCENFMLGICIVKGNDGISRVVYMGNNLSYQH